ncbi:MAG: hypothetical protein IJ308_08105 [Clostridia bacterium]|nr:hypothetical protein [Clostridia bacterium]MBQ7913680.1 hypothetical protein [Clostridia bacterium]
MRKIISLLTAIILLFACVACNNTISNTSHAICSYGSWETTKKATCTTAGEKTRTCTVCGKVETETISALGHTTDSGTCTRCKESFGAWELGEFEDEFGQATGKKYIATMVNGTFSNSATTNSSLIAALQITSTEVAFMLWEYSKNLVKCSYSYDEYSITMLDTEKKKHYLNGTMYAGDSRIYLDSSDKSAVINALKKSGTISFYIVYSEYTTSTYLFSVETSNFKSVYYQL